MEYKSWLPASSGNLTLSLASRQKSRRIEVGLLVSAVMLSLGSYFYHLSHGNILLYGDSMSHLMISKRILSSPTPGVGQSGGLWPPLVHWLSLPMVKNDWLYRTGTASSVLSMAAFVITCVFVYKITRTLLPEEVHWPAVASAVIVMTNRDVLYMQATPMSELPLLAGIVVSVYYFIKWCQDDRIQDLALSSLAVLFATGVRYEGWALLLAFIAAIGYVAFRQRWSWLKLRDISVYFGVFASVFIAFWILWNGTILGDPLGWIRGEYASPSNWVSETDRTVGNPVRAIQVYWYAMMHINGLWLIGVGLVGLVIFMARHKYQPQTCGIYVLVFPLVFYAPLLAAGQRPLHVPELDGDMYNIRFALQTVPFFAILAAFAAYVSLKWISHSLTYKSAALVATIGLSLLAQPTSAITLEEPLAASQSLRSSIQLEAAKCLSEIHQDNEMVLMETYGNERLLFASGIKLDWVIYEGSNQDRLWQSALANPSRYASWVVTRHVHDDADKVWRSISQHRPELLSDYRLVFSNSELAVFQHHKLSERGGESCTIQVRNFSG